MTDLHEPLEPLDSCPDELPPPRQRGDVNLVGLLSVADDLARSLSALKIRVQPYDPKTSLVSPEKAQENIAKEVDRLLGTAVYLQRHAHAAMLGRCVLGADSKEDCSTEGANLQLNVWDGITRRNIVEDGTTGCVAHTVEAARRITGRPRQPQDPARLRQRRRRRRRRPRPWSRAGRHRPVPAPGLGPEARTPRFLTPRARDLFLPATARLL
ncbi:hypothetical protein ACFYNL_38310 [Streptomyces sp. NPDC007808]|uniref:hypothetical protein n=1 Tax=Streptomyces sp. NPDC007808 TaxID=3364779 RepID=UPI0036B2E3F1